VKKRRRTVNCPWHLAAAPQYSLSAIRCPLQCKDKEHVSGRTEQLERTEAIILGNLHFKFTSASHEIGAADARNPS
jgi:hypothetical protein